MKFFVQILGMILIGSTALHAEETQVFSEPGRVVILPHPDKNPARTTLDLEGNLYLGVLVPGGIETKPGMVMGGEGGARFESKGRSVLLFGDLQGEAFNNATKNQDGSGIKFSQFYMNAGLLLGKRNVKWVTPLNVSMERDIVLNDEFMIRYAFSGIYLRLVDENPERAAEKTRKLLEVISDFAVAYQSYYSMGTARTESCTLYGICPSYVSGRGILGLYAAVKYEIERNGWGSDMRAELTQDLSLDFTQVRARLIGFRNLDGDFKGLRPFIEVSGALDHDSIDPVNRSQNSLRLLGGISGNFGF